MCHSPHPSVLLARYDITTQPTGHAALGDPDPTDPRLFFARSGSGLRQAIHRLGRQSPPRRNAVRGTTTVPYCTPLCAGPPGARSRHLLRRKRTALTLFSPFCSNQIQTGSANWLWARAWFLYVLCRPVCSTLRRCDCVVATFFFRFVLQSIYVLAGTRRKESHSEPQTFDSPFSISLRYRILLSLYIHPHSIILYKHSTWDRTSR
jgi:hypothetical protein